MYKKTISIIITISFIFATFTNIEAKNSLNSISKPKFSQKTITINGNENFTTDNGVTSGNGTAENPYIIENIRFNFGLKNFFKDTYGIKIINTNSHLILRNCTFKFLNGFLLFYTYFRMLNKTSCGIYLNNVSNIRVENCKIKGFHQSIELNNKSNNNNIYGCKCLKSFCGIGILDFSNYNTVENCKTYTYGCAICIYENSHYNTIKNCTTRRSAMNLVHNSSNNQIIGCRCTNRMGKGLNIYENANNNTIKNCFFKNNKIGIYIESGSVNNNLIENNFAYNRQHAVDKGKNNWNNETTGNYWNNYRDVDENQDGIWDNPYNITGGENIDNHPLVKPVCG